MLLKKSILGVALAVATLLTACGGGGASGNSTGGNSSSMQTNDVRAGVTSLNAGQSTAITARTVMRGATPSAMVWTVTPLNAINASDPVPTINDPNCAGASFAAPLISGTSGEGTCQAVLTASPSARNGIWRVTNTASAGTAQAPAGSVSNFVDIAINALPESGFRLLESSSPVTGYINKKLTLNIPFTVNPGTSLKNIKYQWTPASENPSAAAIAGASNSTATVVPLAAGPYRWDVKVTAEVNGFIDTATASVVANVYDANYTDVIDAGFPQIVTPNNIVKLIGKVVNMDPAAHYTYSWAQFPGSAGGPAPVTLNNANSPTASFMSPTTTGTYNFVFSTTRDQPDGTKVVTQSQTSVIVQAEPSGVYTINAGAAQTVAIGATAALTGSVGTQGTVTGVTYSYQWAQVGNTPAAVTISNSGSQNASFIPTVAGSYNFTLTVTAKSASGTTTLVGQTQVIATSSGAPGTPSPFAMTADSGPAQTVPANAVATLTGSKTTQGLTNGVTFSYAWTQVGATPAVATLSNVNTAVATFVPTVGGVYTFRLVVTATLPDGTTKTANSESQVVVGGVGNAFTVSAGNAQSVGSGTATVMTGIVTTQGSWAGATFAYTWTQVGAVPAAVTISNSNALIASFVPTVSGTYTFELSVAATDGAVTTTKLATTQVLVP